MGIPLAVGVLPAVMMPIPAARKPRIAILLIGVVAGVSMFLGGVLAHLPVAVAAIVLAVLVMAAAVLSSVHPRARLVLTLCVPLMAAGLSYSDWATSAATMLLLIAGSTWAWLVSLLWPVRAHQARQAPTRATPDPRAMLAFGARLGIAAMLAYLIAASWGLDHPGWAPAAALLVARPQLDLLESRGVGRALAVLVGASAAAVTIWLELPNLAYGFLAVAVLAAAAATSGSRWYVTPGFATYFVFILLVYDQPAESAQKLGERVGETALGVALAFVFCWLIPAARRRRTRSG